VIARSICGARVARWAVWALLSTGGATIARAQERGGPLELSLRDALGLARLHNPGFLAQQNDATVADANVRAAYADLALPQASTSSSLGYSAAGERRTGSVSLGGQPSIYSSSYTLSLSYTLSATRLAQPATAKAERRATRLRIDAAEATLRHDVIQQYLAVLQAHQTLDQIDAELRRSTEYLKLARVRNELGAVSPLEVQRAEVQLAQGEVKGVRAGNQLATARLALGRIIGVALPAGVRLTTTFDLLEPHWHVDTLVALALRGNASLRALQAAGEASAVRLTTALGAYLPTVAVNVGTNGWAQRAGSLDDAIHQRMGTSSDTALEARLRSQIAGEYRGFPFNYARQPLSASITISLPLLQGWNRETQLAQANAALADARYQVRGEELRIRAEVESALLALETAYRVALLQRTVREKAAEELRLAQERTRFGALGAIAVTDAQAQLAQAELDEIDAVYDVHKQLADLEALVGAPLR
jgi:outer membrane protein